MSPRSQLKLFQLLTKVTCNVDGKVDGKSQLALERGFGKLSSGWPRGHGGQTFRQIMFRLRKSVRF
jgi:hypothetical protein